MSIAIAVDQLWSDRRVMSTQSGWVVHYSDYGNCKPSVDTGHDFKNKYTLYRHQNGANINEEAYDYEERYVDEDIDSHAFVWSIPDNSWVRFHHIDFNHNLYLLRTAKAPCLKFDTLYHAMNGKPRNSLEAFLSDRAKTEGDIIQARMIVESWLTFEDNYDYDVCSCGPHPCAHCMRPETEEETAEEKKAKFLKFLDETAEKVRKWPKWKQNILGRPDDD